jgi:phosphoenolpyruvate-protein phosphotransferase
MLQLTETGVRLGAHARDKHDAIAQVGTLLAADGRIETGYIASMQARETLADTYLGNGIAIPHGRPEDRELIRATGIAVLQLPQGVSWNRGETAHLIVGIAARSAEHIDVLRRLTRVLGDRALVEKLRTTADPADIIEALTGERPQPLIAAAVDFAARVAVRVINPTGLHARPATAFVELARGFSSAVRVRFGNEAADGKSMLELLQLGISSGSLITISAEGDDAASALAVLADAVAQGLGDDHDADTGPGFSGTYRRDWQPQQISAVIHGIAAAEGLAYGPLRRFQRESLRIDDTPTDRLTDSSRLQEAIDGSREELQHLAAEVAARLGSSRAAIFQAHAELLNDSGLLRETISRIFDGHGAAWAWQQVIDARVAQLAKVDDAVMAARAVDLSDVGQRVLRRLLGLPSVAALTLNTPAILIADDLTPSDTAGLDPDSVLGLCTALGGPTSHTAIIARSLGLPAVVAAGADLLAVHDGTVAILDGFAGRLYLQPGAADIAAVQAMQQGLDHQQAAALADRLLPAVTVDGVLVEVAANVNRVSDAERAVEVGADGVGLMRTEFLFLERDRAPDEEEQYQAYRAMAEALGGRPLIIRTLDIGGDKEVPYLNIPREDNSFLGIRGIRLCLARPDLFEPQLRAIYRAAAHGNIKMMFPMIATLEDVQQARAAAERVRAELGVPAIEIGIMVEVPSAAVMADQLAEEVDFFSVGTNDLTQYVLAMDRLHPQLASRTDGLHPAVLRMIAQTVAAAEQHGRWVGVCGGVAGDPLGAAILVGLGVSELSVSVPSIAQIKAQLRTSSAAELRDLAQRALRCRSAAEVRAL